MEKVTDIRVTSNGAKYENEEVVISFPGNKKSKVSATIEIWKKKYKKSGVCNPISHSKYIWYIQCSMNEIPEYISVGFKNLKNSNAIDDNIKIPLNLIFSHQKVYNSIENSLEELAIPSVAELSNNKTSFTKIFYFKDLATNSEQPEKHFEIGFSSELPDNKTFLYQNTQSELGKNAFCFLMDKNDLDQQEIFNLMDLIENQYRKLSSLKLINESEISPMILFKDLSKKAPAGFFYSINQKNCSWIQIDKDLLNNYKNICQDSKALNHLKVNIANALLGTFQGIDSKTKWFDMAVKTWYEPIAVGNAGYLPEKLVENLTMLNSPLLYCDISENQDKNCPTISSIGNSFFINYLSVYRNDGLTIHKIYQNYQKKGGYISNSIADILHNKPIGQIYSLFVDKMLRFPSQLFPGLDNRSIISKLNHDEVVANVECNQKICLINWSASVSSDACTYLETDAGIEIDYKLLNLSTQTLMIKMKGIENGKYPRIQIEIAGSAKSGAQVYFIDEKGLYPIACGIKHLQPHKNKTLTIEAVHNILIAIMNKDESIEALSPQEIKIILSNKRNAL